MATDRKRWRIVLEITDIPDLADGEQFYDKDDIENSFNEVLANSTVDSITAEEL